MVDVGDRLTRERLREAIDEAQLELSLALDDYDDLVDAVFTHLGPYSELAILRRHLAKTVDTED